MSSHPLPVLSLLEARVLAVLVEKEQTVPDTYPLTVNALVAGCNQKSSRDPVMDVTESDVSAALERLQRASLVIESSGSRVMRYSQNVRRVLGVPGASVALLATLMLRGPQTAGELRGNCDRLHRFSDISAVEGFLHELAAWPAGALVAELPRQPGARENRWMHLLCGPAPVAVTAATGSGAATGSAPWTPPAPPASPDRLAGLEARLAELEARVAGLAAELDRLRATGGA